jgi:hypothetical protein
MEMNKQENTHTNLNEGKVEPASVPRPQPQPGKIHQH